MVGWLVVWLSEWECGVWRGGGPPGRVTCSLDGWLGGTRLARWVFGCLVG